VVAGLTDTCAQKNHNLLAALEHAGTPDVYVFADADIEAPPQWLQRLVLPLSDAKVTATSGFRWMIMRSRPRRQQAHVYENNFLYTLFTAACFFGGVGLWGGSMAIRRKDFEELQVAGYWARTAVDDMTLSQLLIKKHKKAVLVPECVMDTEDSIPTLGKAIYWFERQSMFLKAYHKPAWVPAIPVALVLLALHALLPVSIVLGLVTGEHFFTWGGGAALISLAGDMLSVLLFPLIGTVPRFFRFFFWHILYRSIPLLGFVATLKNNTIMWGGVRYTFDIAGRVTRVQR
jgi:cellulose synthase/poly-beta-1,6-N-acetylglucosamine synthase-like glycosyltransferase